jgi:glucose-1-phosphate thymidylyltransferase
MERQEIRARGLVCAGGEATRLQELTRLTNKHLLPVGRWPMVYYPLQLMELLGIRDVLLVTGQQHGGDFIDLLGDGRVREREGEALLFDLDLTYKVQTEPGGIAQVVGMAEAFAAGQKLVVCLGDNIFEYVEVEAVRAWTREPHGALIFVKEVSDPERFGVVVHGADGRVVDVVEKAGVVDTRYSEPPSSDAVVGLYCYPPDVFEVIRGLEPSQRGELEITDVNRSYAEQGRLECRHVTGWWHDAGTHDALGRIGNLIEETGANKLR